MSEAELIMTLSCSHGGWNSYWTGKDDSITADCRRSARLDVHSVNFIIYTNVS